jgi:hypothetical protein
MLSEKHWCRYSIGILSKQSKLESSISIPSNSYNGAALLTIETLLSIWLMHLKACKDNTHRI